ncbi:MAG: VOC family protein [Armatimonadetes bacterium]|nr:VOC family protein [Armatimonadota bacterium]
MFAVRLDHVAITVSDLERSLRFYRDQLGMLEQSDHDLKGPEISQMAGKDKVYMKVVRLTCPETPGVQIDLQQYIEPKGKQSDSKLGDVANSHICIEVGNLDDAYRRLSAAGVQFVSPPVEFDLEAEGKIGCVFFMDPDGYILELTEYRKKES